MDKQYHVLKYSEVWKKGHSGTVDFTGQGDVLFTDMEVFKGQGNDTGVLRLI